MVARTGADKRTAETQVRAAAHARHVTHRQDERRHTLLAVALTDWPFAGFDKARARDFLARVGRDLAKCLDPDTPPPLAMAHRRAAESSSDPNCWLVEVRYQVCPSPNEEQLCRCEYWECDDGSWRVYCEPI